MPLATPRVRPDIANRPHPVTLGEVAIWSVRRLGTARRSRPARPTTPRAAPRPLRVALRVFFVSSAFVVALPWIAGTCRSVGDRLRDQSLSGTEPDRIAGLSLSWFGAIRLTGLTFKDARGKTILDATKRALLDPAASSAFWATGRGWGRRRSTAPRSLERRADGSIDLVDALTSPNGRRAAAPAKGEGGGWGLDLTFRVVRSSLRLRSPELAEPLTAGLGSSTWRSSPWPRWAGSRAGGSGCRARLAEAPPRRSRRRRIDHRAPHSRARPLAERQGPGVARRRAHNPAATSHAADSRPNAGPRESGDGRRRATRRCSSSSTRRAPAGWRATTSGPAVTGSWDAGRGRRGLDRPQAPAACRSLPRPRRHQWRRAIRPVNRRGRPRAESTWRRCRSSPRPRCGSARGCRSSRLGAPRDAMEDRGWSPAGCSSRRGSPTWWAAPTPRDVTFNAPATSRPARRTGSGFSVQSLEPEVGLRRIRRVRGDL